MAEIAIPPGETGRTMPIMLSSVMQDRMRKVPRMVVVDQVPWELFDEQAARAACERNHQQTIERIAERGGFDAGEAVAVLTGMGHVSGKMLREDLAHRVLYQMVHLFRRGVLTGMRTREA